MAAFDRAGKITGRFYISAAGRPPVREWLLGLAKDDRRTVGRGLWKVRNDLAGGRIARVIFCIVGGEMVLLHGFEKKSQKTPAQDIEVALRRKKEIE